MADFDWMICRMEEAVDVPPGQAREVEVVQGPVAFANADGVGRSLLRSDFCRYARQTGCA
jgi:hypothetical protein